MASNDASSPFVVQGKRRNGTVTYLCPHAEWALRKLADFERAGYTGITVSGPDGMALDEGGLRALRDARRASEPAET